MREAYGTRLYAAVVGASLAMIAGCLQTTPPSSEVGAIAGMVTSSQGGGIANTTVTATTDSGGEHVGTTDSTGHYLINGVPDGNGTIGIGALPLLCTAPGVIDYDVIATDTTSLSVTVTCGS